MKQRGLPPWDLTASVLVAAIALALSIFPFEPIYSSAGPLLFVLVLLLPGYLLSIALFPRRYDLAGKGRLALGIMANVLLALIFSLGLSLSPWGLSPSSLAAALAIVSLVMAVVAHLSRSALPMWNRFVPFISGSGRRPLERRREAGISRRVVDKIPMLAAAVVLMAIAYTAVNNGYIGGGNQTGDTEAPFTEFYIQGENREDHPLSIVAGSRTTTVAGIVNHELGAVNYTLRVVQNSSILSQKEITLDHNQSWEGTIDYVLKDPGSSERLDFLLYKDGDFSVPYSEDHLWLNVSNANATPENYSETSDEDTITLEQSRKVVVLGADEDDSENDKDKRSSYLGKASSQVFSEPASQNAIKPQSRDEIEQFSLQEMESEPAMSSGRKDEGLQASSENSSRDIDAPGSMQRSEITEGKEKLVATAVNSEISEIENQETDEGTDEAKEPAKGDAAAQAPSADQEAPSPSEEDKNDVAASKADQSISQKEEADETSEIDSEIDSWVSSRGFSKSDQGQAFNSKDIQYVKKGDAKESAVLGSQSKTPVKVGR